MSLDKTTKVKKEISGWPNLGLPQKPKIWVYVLSERV